MRAIMQMDTVQIEITNACIKSCANCTRFVGHVKPYYISIGDFKRAIDSMVGYPKMTGIMGGEPLLHPYFSDFCKYLQTKIPKEQCGLWTTLPRGYEHYREIIVETFEHIFINDHSRNDIYHHPGLVAIEEIILDKDLMWNIIDQCWAQMSWSASINPRGAFFCEIAAAMAMLYREGTGWDVEPRWWMKTPKDFTAQIEQWCPRCGFAVPLQRRCSNDDVDDISPKRLEVLKMFSLKIQQGRYKLHDLKMVQACQQKPLAAYKDINYRNRIARRYGMFVTVNQQGFWTPMLLNNWTQEQEAKLCGISSLAELDS